MHQVSVTTLGDRKPGHLSGHPNVCLRRAWVPAPNGLVTFLTGRCVNETSNPRMDSLFWAKRVTAHCPVLQRTPGENGILKCRDGLKITVNPEPPKRALESQSAVITGHQRRPGTLARLRKSRGGNGAERVADRWPSAPPLELGVQRVTG